MREIDLYKLQPEHVVGSTDNIDLLSKKNSKDDEVLTEIEQDYKTNEEKYKKEYINAKLNFKKNLNLYAAELHNIS